jgi:hypothetical protein
MTFNEGENMNVNMVFHGVFAFILNDKTLEVLFPFFSPHEYLFGCWVQGDPMRLLQPLPKGELKISGIRGIDANKPNPDFPDDLVPAVHGQRERCSDNLFCRLDLPAYPKAVYGFRTYDRPPQNGAPIDRFPFIGIHGDSLRPTALAGPMVLCFEADSPDAVNAMYHNKPLHFERILSPDKKAFNIHFFAEGMQDLPNPRDLDRVPQVSVHYQEVWSRLTGLVFGLDIRLGKLWPFVIGQVKPLPPQTGVPGLSREELAELDEIHDIGGIGGDHSDCEKAHIIVDNRVKRNAS